MKKLLKKELKRLQTENSELRDVFKKVTSTPVMKKIRKERELREKSEMFWFLQVQFLEMSHNTLSALSAHLWVSGMRNEPISQKVYENREALATHLALQFAGVEE